MNVVFDFLTPKFAPSLSTFLFNGVLAVAPASVLLLTVLSILLALFFALFLGPVVYVTFSQRFTHSRHVPMTLFRCVLVVFVTLAVMSYLHVMNVMLTVSLLALPRVATGLFARDFGGVV